MVYYVHSRPIWSGWGIDIEVNDEHYQGKVLEIVKNFSYLGMTFSTTGSLTKAQQVLASQGNKALFELKRYCNKFENIKPSLMCELFDRLIEPILSYGSEVWGFHEAPHVERLHMKFCKWTLCVKTSTPNAIVRCELGRTDLQTKRYVKIIKYWMKILECDNARYIKTVYDVLVSDVENNKINWASNVKNLLYSVGMGDAWFFQTVGDYNIFIFTNIDSI